MGDLSGRRLGVYEILAPLGAGGMGEVYRARDTRLDRTVAIKVLAPHLAAASDSKARFEREARSISALNHPNICRLYDVGSEDGTDFLVMEYLVGESLADRLKKGPVAFEQVLKIAIEIADALEQAHAAGIVHRDLKPSNIMLTKSGAKLLDFGLAKPAFGAVGAACGASAELTQTSPAAPISSAGAIIGTVHYMAPEQIEGKEVDARTDIFALGAVVYELSTGRRPFEGKSAMSVAAAVLQSEPQPMATIQPHCSPALDYVVRTCLAKDPNERFQSAHDLKLQLTCLLHSGAAPGERGRRKSIFEAQAFRWALVTAPVLVLALIGLKFVPAHPPPQAHGVTRFSMVLPTGQELATDTTQAVVLAPDGRRLAYVAAEAGVPHLYVRRLDRFEGVEIPDSEGAVFPFFSPSGDWVAFFSQGKLKKAPADGGNPVPICDLPTFFGGTWTADDSIAVAVPSLGLATVPAAGGSLEKVALATSEHVYPQGPMWLPPADWITFTDFLGSTRRLFAVKLSSGELRLIQTNAQAASYSEGKLVYYSGGALWAADFDRQRLRVHGPAMQLASGVNEENYIAQASASANGVLAYAPGEASNFSRNLYLVNRRGIEEKLAVPADDYVDPAISPDGRRIAICIRSVGTNGQQLALYDRVNRVLTRLVSNGAMNEAPVWSADGRSLLFNVLNATSQKQGIYRIAADGNSAPELLAERSFTAHVTAAAAHEAVVMVSDPVTSADLWLLRLEPPYSMRVFRRTPFTEGQATFSPDGHWLAYSSNESGRSEIYVEAVPGPGGRWQISAGGGEQPRWSRNGREIFYRNGTKMMSVLVVTSPVFRAAPAKELFDRRFDRGGSVGGYDASPDGELFVLTRSEHQSATEIRVVVGWSEEKQASR